MTATSPISRTPSTYAPPAQPSLADFIDIPLLVSRWRLVVGGALATGLVVGLISLSTPRKYVAAIRVAAVTPSRLPTGGGGGLVASLAGLSGSGGLQVTPSLVAEFLRLDGVLLDVGKSKLPNGRTLVAQLTNEEYGPQELYKVPLVLNQIIGTNVSRETGLITLSATSTDSALARTLVDRLLGEASRRFILAAQAQARQLRVAQENRVEDAERRLRIAREEYRAFRDANRTIAQYSPTSVNLARLEQNQVIAQQVYTTAVADKESAVAKELEQTPVVVVVDPVPPQLRPQPRRTLLRAVLGVVLAGFAISMAILAQHASRSGVGAS